MEIHLNAATQTTPTKRPVKEFLATQEQTLALNSGDEVLVRETLNNIIEDVSAYVRLAVTTDSSEAELSKLGADLLNDYGITDTWDAARNIFRVYSGSNTIQAIHSVPYYASAEEKINPLKSVLTLVTRPTYEGVTALGVNTGFVYMTKHTNRLDVVEQPSTHKPKIKAQFAAYAGIEQIVLSATADTKAADLHRAIIMHLAQAGVTVVSGKRIGYGLKNANWGDTGITPESVKTLGDLQHFHLSVPMAYEIGAVRQGMNFTVRTNGTICRI